MHPGPPPLPAVSTGAGPGATRGAGAGPRDHWLPWLLFGLLALRLAVRTDGYAVDLLFWDQWDFWQPLFGGTGPWSFFRLQHGPHREGLGGVAIWAVAQLSGWNVRAEVFASCAVVLAGALCGMLLARRLRGRLDAWDAAVPLLLVGGLHAECLTHTPNAAHGPFPYALILAAALWAVSRSRAVRVLSAALLAPFAMFTGFGLLFAPFLLLLLALELMRARAEGAGSSLPIAAALCGSALLCASFFLDYTPTAAVDCFRFPDPHPLRYFPYAGVVLARPLVIGDRALRGFVAVVEIVPLLAAIAWGSWRALRTLGAEELPRTVLLLGGFAVLFSASTAVGRVCQGLNSAGLPRYAPYVTPALLAGWLVLRARGPRWTRTGGPWLVPTALALVLAACVGKELWLETHPANETVLAAAGKRATLACLRRGESAESCAARTGFAIYPRPAATHLQEKLDWMRDRRLGPFRE